jgi:hypothetical protein
MTTPQNPIIVVKEPQTPQIIVSNLVPYGVGGAGTVTWDNVADKPSGLVSSSAQVDFTEISNKPTLVSASSQVSYTGLSNIPSGIVSASSQVNYTQLSGIPAGIVSSSAQINTGSFSGSFIGTASYANNANLLDGKDSTTFATTGSNTFVGNQIISGSVQNPDTIDFRKLTNAPTYAEGRLWYNTDDGALEVYNDEAEIALKIGQQEYLRVENRTGNTITKGAPVYVSGSLGDKPLIHLAVAEDHTGIEYIYDHITGLATHNIENNTTGYITTYGIINNVNTVAFPAGAVLYVSSSAGKLTTQKPVPPLDIINVGTVVRSHAQVGIIFVSPREPIHFGNISGLSGSLTPPNGATWVYDEAKKVWFPSLVLPNITASGSFSGSLTGTATNAVSSSYALTASFALNGGGDTGSFATTGSNTFNGGQIISASGNLITSLNTDTTSGDKFIFVMQGQPTANGVQIFQVRNQNTSAGAAAVEASSGTQRARISITNTAALIGGFSNLNLWLVQNSNVRWVMDASSLFPFFDVGQNIGSTTNRVSQGFFGTSVRIGNADVGGTNDRLRVSGSAVITGNTAIGKQTATSVLDILGNSKITGSLDVSGGITGSLFGTASWATNAINAAVTLTIDGGFADTQFDGTDITFDGGGA